MAKCVKCGRSSLSLKVDSFGLCPDCQSLSKRIIDDRISNMEAELNTLRAFYAEYSVIPTASAEAGRILDEARAEATAILTRAKEESEKLHASADSYRKAAELEISMQRKRAEDHLAKVKSDAKLAVSYTESQLSALFALAARDFAHQGKTTAANVYSSVEKNSPAYCAVEFIALTPSAFKRETKRGYVVFDVETTGLDKNSDAIIEIGAIKYDQYGNEVDMFSKLVNPGIPIPRTASAINGITDAMVANAQRIDTILPAFYQFVRDLPLVAHNAEFDIAFIRNATARIGFSAISSVSYGDSLAMARKTYKLSSYRLGAIAEHLCIPVSNAHRATGDCDMLGEIMKDILFNKYHDE